jgi:hypothetical protein
MSNSFFVQFMNYTLKKVGQFSCRTVATGSGVGQNYGIEIMRAIGTPPMPQKETELKPTKSQVRYITLA